MKISKIEFICLNGAELIVWLFECIIWEYWTMTNSQTLILLLFENVFFLFYLKAFQSKFVLVNFLPTIPFNLFNKNAFQVCFMSYSFNFLIFVQY